MWWAREGGREVWERDREKEIAGWGGREREIEGQAESEGGRERERERGGGRGRETEGWGERENKAELLGERDENLLVLRCCGGERLAETPQHGRNSTVSELKWGGMTMAVVRGMEVCWLWGGRFSQSEMQW